MTTSAFGMARSSASAQPAPAASAPVRAEVLDVARRPAPLASACAMILAALLLGFAAYVGGLGAVVHARSQQLAYAELREQLANATAPLGPLASNGTPLELGTPIGLMEAPGIREVVREGTTAGVLTGGPGHRRDTPMPGQPGTALVYGRKAGFGGPFAHVASLAKGTRIVVTTGQGRHEFRVTGVRVAGDPLPPSGPSRLTLVTAAGSSFAPDGAVFVDADLVTATVPGPGRIPVAMSLAERPLAGDRGALVPLVLWGQALVLSSLLVVWMSIRWGRRQAWLVGVPVLAALGIATAGSSAQLLPNLL